MAVKENRSIVKVNSVFKTKFHLVEVNSAGWILLIMVKIGSKQRKC